MILQCRLIRCTETHSHIFARNFKKRTFSCLIYLHICTRPQFSDETANFPHLCSTKGVRQSKILFPFLRTRFNSNRTYNYVTTYPRRSTNIFLLILYQNGTSIYIVLPLILSCNVWLLKVKRRNVHANCSFSKEKVVGVLMQASPDVHTVLPANAAVSGCEIRSLYSQIPRAWHSPRSASSVQEKLTF